MQGLTEDGALCWIVDARAFPSRSSPRRYLVATVLAVATGCGWHGAGAPDSGPRDTWMTSACVESSPWPMVGRDAWNSSHSSSTVPTNQPSVAWTHTVRPDSVWRMPVVLAGCGRIVTRSDAGVAVFDGTGNELGRLPVHEAISDITVLSPSDIVVSHGCSVSRFTADGLLAWRRDFCDSFASTTKLDVSDPTRIVLAQGTTLRALASDTGEVVWERRNLFDSSLLTRAAHPAPYVISTSANTVYATSATDGTTVWQRTVGNPSGIQGLSSPVVVGDQIWVATISGTIASLAIDSGVPSFTRDMRMGQLLVSGSRSVVAAVGTDVVSFDLMGSEQWRVTLGAVVDGAIIGAIAIDANDVIVAATAREIVAVRSGIVLWRVPYQGTYANALAIDADGDIVLGTTDARIYVVRGS